MPTEISEAPEGGEVELTFPFGPVSLQSSSERRNFLRAQIDAHCPKFGFLLSGDVSVEITWMIHEKERYESPHATDIDNALKPLLDAISGPNGVIINDTQVQHISCSWIDWTTYDEAITVRLRYMSDEFVRKDGLIFLRMPDSQLCFPFNTTFPAKASLGALDILDKEWRLRTQMADRGYEIARYAMPTQRFFHSIHLRGYTVVPFAEYKERLETAPGPDASRI